MTDRRNKKSLFKMRKSEVTQIHLQSYLSCLRLPSRKPYEISCVSLTTEHFLSFLKIQKRKILIHLADHQSWPVVIIILEDVGRPSFRQFQLFKIKRQDCEQAEWIIDRPLALYLLS